MTADPSTVSVFALRMLAGVLPAFGVAPATVLEAADWSIAALADNDVRVPAPVAFAAFEEAARRAGDPRFALHAASKVPLGAAGFLDYAARSSPTLGEALRRLIRYHALVNSSFEMRIEERGDEARLVQAARVERERRRQLAEFQIAMIVARGRAIAGEWPLRAVAFAHAAPADTSEHRRFFEADVRFGQLDDEIVFERQWLDRALPTADPELASVLERYGDALLASLPASDSFLDQARRAVAAALRGGEPGVDATAARLGLGRRSVQRKLQEAGTSYQELVDGVRRDLALRWLAQDDAAITEVAYMLGFSEPAAFHRAFKRWTGLTPAAYRRAQLGR